MVDSQRNDDFISDKARGVRELLDIIQGNFYEVKEYTGERNAPTEGATTRSSGSGGNSPTTMNRRQLAKQNNGTWNRIKEELNDNDIEQSRRVLNFEFDRIVEVIKDIPPPGSSEGRHEKHRTYKACDTLLDMLLRHNPPESVLDLLAKILPEYYASRKLFRIVKETHLADDNWDFFMMKFNKLSRKKTEKGYGLDTDQIYRVFLIRHTWREDTILSLCARRNPPLRVIQSISNACRDSVCVVDCRKWDWIPIQYAIAHHARPEVIEALIPTQNDRTITDRPYCGYHYCASYDHSSGERSFHDNRDVLFRPDYHYRTPLHWAAYYDAPLETIQILRNACSEDILLIEDHCGHEPYKTGK